MSKKIIAFIALSVLSFSSFAFADMNNMPAGHGQGMMNKAGNGGCMGMGHNGNHMGHGMGHGMGHNMGMMHQMKNSLTAAQQAEFTKITEAFVEKVNPLKVQLASKSAEYNALLLNDNPNPAQAGKLAGDIAQLNQKIEAEQMNYFQTLETKFNTK